MLGQSDLMLDRRGWFIALGSRIGCLVGFQTGNWVPNTNLVVFSIMLIVTITPIMSC